MKYPRLIIVTGVDGSGKTTTARFLVKYLKSNGCKTRYVWIKSLHTLAFLISRVFESLGWHRVIQNPNRVTISRFELPDSASHHKIWPFIEFISVLPWIILRIHLPLFLGFTIVADRYLIDTIVSISIGVRDPLFMNSFLGKLLLRMIPKEAIIIHLDVDLINILNRKPNIEYTNQEIMRQITLYRLLAKGIGAYSINTAILNAKETTVLVLDLITLEND